jgi:hypothetical protein
MVAIGKKETVSLDKVTFYTFRLFFKLLLHIDKTFTQEIPLTYFEKHFFSLSIFNGMHVFIIEWVPQIFYK